MGSLRRKGGFLLSLNNLIPFRSLWSRAMLHGSWYSSVHEASPSWKWHLFVLFFCNCINSRLFLGNVNKKKRKKIRNIFYHYTSLLWRFCYLLSSRLHELIHCEERCKEMCIFPMHSNACQWVHPSKVAWQLFGVLLFSDTLFFGPWKESTQIFPHF